MDQQPVHPPLPFGLGSLVTLTGFAGAVAAFVIAYWQAKWHMTPEIATLGVAALGTIAAWFHGRSKQAAALIERGSAILKDVGISVSTAPPAAVTVETTPPPAPPTV